MAHYRRVEETLWRELELLPGQEMCLLCEIAVRGGWDFREESSVKDWQPQ